ncbi:NADP-dependent oxidoreductase domain-containing protein [Mucidula mucida]|nr:NADP-dependent oxidoreductase domain-containing protein [Mucidula mucida]
MTCGKRTWLPWLLKDEEESIRQIKAAYDAGINTFDTANSYSNGYSEVVLGKTIKQHALPREEIVVMTRYFKSSVHFHATGMIFRLSGDGCVNQHGLSRKHIFDSVKQSLERCNWTISMHRFDSETPIAETMQALHDVVKAGYEEREMMPTLKHFGVGAMPFAALGRGMLTRPLDKQNTEKANRIGNGCARVEEIAAKRNIRWVKSHWRGKDGTWRFDVRSHYLMRVGTAVSAPIIGTSSTKNLMELIGSVNVKLTVDEVKYLEEPYQPLPIMH